MKNIKAIIFDLDGIIIDSEPWQKLAFDLTVKPYNIHFNDEQFTKLIGIKSIDNFIQIKKEYNINISAEELTEIKNNNYYNILKQEIKHRDHFPELLEYVQSRYILSVASSSRKKDVYTSLELLNLIENFKIILTGDDVKNGKPDPEIFIKTADKLNIPCKECAVIEDSQNGINAAKKADMTAIAVPTDYTKTHDFSNANYIFENLSMITTIL